MKTGNFKVKFKHMQAHTHLAPTPPTRVTQKHLRNTQKPLWNQNKNLPLLDHLLHLLFLKCQESR